ARSGGIRAALGDASVVRRGAATTVGEVPPVLRVGERCRHGRSRCRHRSHRGRVYGDAREMGAEGTRAVLLASSAVEASASRHAEGVGRSTMSRATDRLKTDKRAWFGVGVIVLLALMAIAAPLVARHDPFGVDLINSLQPPSWSHWFGTDIQGRDVWARLVYGSRVSLSVGVISQGIALSLGVI